MEQASQETKGAAMGSVEPPRLQDRTAGLHRPSRHMVEKKAMLRVSRGLSCVHSGERVCGSDSPVSEELSTLQPWADRMRMSAGTRSPPFISTRSPTTSWSALIWNLSPSRITVACCGGGRGSGSCLLSRSHERRKSGRAEA